MDIDPSYSQDDISLSFPARKEDKTTTTTASTSIPIPLNTSMLSSDDEEEEDSHHQPSPPISDLLYMEHASMEATPERPNVTKIQAHGRLGRRLSSRSDCILVDVSPSIDDNDSLHVSKSEESSTRWWASERDVFVVSAAEGDDSVDAVTAAAYRTETTTPAAGQPQHMNESSHTNNHAAAEPPPVSPSKLSPRGAWNIMKKYGVLPKAPWKLNKSNSEALCYLFETFCDPPIPKETCRSLLHLEEQDGQHDSNINCTLLPDPTTICLHDQSRIVALLLHTQCLQELGVAFVATVLRILVRLLSNNESDLHYSVSVGALPPTDLPIADDNNNNNNLTYYQVVRFYCSWMRHCHTTTPHPNPLAALETVLDLRDMLSPALFRPLSRLVSVLAAASVTPRLLRSRLRFQVQPTPPPPVPHTFVFAGSEPLHRTITGLSHWPFRNDFGCALWFRAERFTPGVTITLVSVEMLQQEPSSHHKVQLQLQLIPVADGGACTLSVSTGAATTVHQPGGFCVLPRVWYHVAVRHTRARMKGVFKLSSREQLSILLNAKTMVTTEDLPFPPAEDAKSRVSIQISMGRHLEGQTGALYLFDDHVSDASLRALYELSARSTVQQRRPMENSWDSRRGDLVRKSRVLDATITKDDADEIVLSHRRPRRGGTTQAVSHVIDLLGVEENDDIPPELSFTAFGSKVFLSWDPRRTVGNKAVELHIGAHVALDGVLAWSFTGAQDAISSVGGVQALIPLFRSQLLGNWASRPYGIHTIITDLFNILSSYVRDHNDNARELLRCGGIDVVEQFLLSARKVAAGKKYNSTVFGTLNSHPKLVSMMVNSLFELRTACSHYVGLETKVYSRLLFNPNLWFGGFSHIPGASLQTELLPILAKMAVENPQKVRDCVGAAEMVQLIKTYALDETEGENEDENRFRNPPSGYSPSPLNRTERHQCVGLFLGIVFNILASGTTPRDLSPLLHLLAFALDDGRASTEAGTADSKLSTERKELAVKIGSTLMLLLQLRPCIPGLYESIAHTCGGVQGGASWILSALVDTRDDEIRSIGIRCLANYLEVTSRGPDSHLAIVSMADSVSGTDLDSNADLGIRTPVQRTRSRIQNLAKGIATIGPSVRNFNFQPSKLTTRVVFKVCLCVVAITELTIFAPKLLWHLLKSHRAHLGPLTHSAILGWITDDETSASISLANLRFVTERMTVLVNGQSIFCIDYDWIVSKLKESGNLAAKVLRNPAAVATVFRLLRFLDINQRDQWLVNIIQLSKSNRKCVALLAGLPAWQHSLFSFISETLEQVSSRSREQGVLLGDRELFGESATEREPLENLYGRLDLSLNLYGILLGHLLRNGGDQALEAVETTAALERVFVNGHDVLLLVLSSFCCNIAEEGTLLEVGALSAQDWKDVDLETILLKQSAKLVTDAIISNGTQGLEMATAVRSWRGIRHLFEVIVSVAGKCGYVCNVTIAYTRNDLTQSSGLVPSIYSITLPRMEILTATAQGVLALPKIGNELMQRNISRFFRMRSLLTTEK